MPNIPKWWSQLKPWQKIATVIFILFIIGIFVPEEPQPQTTQQPKQPSIWEQTNSHGITGSQFVEACQKHAATQLLQNPETAKHPGLLDQSLPVLVNDAWLYITWIEGSSAIGQTARIQYRCNINIENQLSITPL